MYSIVMIKCCLLNETSSNKTNGFRLFHKHMTTCTFKRETCNTVPFKLVPELNESEGENAFVIRKCETKKNCSKTH